jgi:hypothetical protein
MFNRTNSTKIPPSPRLRGILRSFSVGGFRAKTPPKTNPKSQARNLKQTKSLKSEIRHPKRDCLEFCLLYLFLRVLRVLRGQAFCHPSSLLRMTLSLPFESLRALSLSKWSMGRTGHHEEHEGHEVRNTSCPVALPTNND